MQDSRRIYTFVTRGSERASSAWRVANAQPSWVSRAALLTFLVVVGLPLALLICFAAVLAAAVFLALAGLYKLRLLFSGSDGRENVKVIRRPEA